MTGEWIKCNASAPRHNKVQFNSAHLRESEWTSDQSVSESRLIERDRMHAVKLAVSTLGLHANSPLVHFTCCRTQAKHVCAPQSTDAEEARAH